MKKQLVLMALLVATVSLVPAFSQTESVARKMALFITFTGNVTESEKTLLAETLLVRVSELAHISVIEPMRQLQKDITYKEKQSIAETMGADAYLTVAINGVKDSITYTYLSFDIANGKLAIEEKSIERDRELRGLHLGFWNPLVSDLASNYKMISGKLTVKEIRKFTGEESVVQKEKGVKVVIVAQSGTKLNGLGPETVTVDDEGLARIDLPQSATYEVYATCDGYYPVRKQFYVGNEPLRIELEQETGSVFAIDAFLHQADYAGAGFRYYYMPNRQFIDASLTLFFWKLIWPTDHDRSAYEAPVILLEIATGRYFNEADSLFRFSFSQGIFFRFAFTDTLGFTLDPISRFGISVWSIDLEFSTMSKVRFFFEHNLNLYFTSNGDLFRLALTNGGSSEENTAGYIFSGSAVLDFLDFKVGVRFQL